MNELDTMISEAVAIQANISAQTARLKDLKSRIEAMCDFPEGKNTAHVCGAGYDVAVQRKSNVRWDQRKLEAARAAMGNEEFFKVFSWEFKPQSAKQLEAFFLYGNMDHARLVLSARTISPGAPQFTFTPIEGE